jgi:hypothetical protein
MTDSFTHEPRIVRFTCDGDPGLFQKYLSLKYRVFVEEMGWDILPNRPAERIVLEDAQDRHSHFCIALSDTDDPIGIVRGTLPASFEAMYRRELYDEFFRAPCIQDIEGRVATINAIAVPLPFRRSEAAANYQSAQGSEPISDLLMRCMISRLSDLGTLLIVLSAIEGGALSLMKRVGFRAINPPHELLGRDYSSKPDAKRLRIYDMALTLGAGDDTDDDRKTGTGLDQRLVHKIGAYIREREAKLGPL